jgi:hypothetical protein
MIKYIQKANNFIRSKKMAVIDWTLSIAFVIYGVYLLCTVGANMTSVLTTVCGVIGLILAKIRPAVKIQDYLEKRMINRMRS